MELDTNLAIKALKAWCANLPRRSSSEEFGPPEWIHYPASPTLVYTMRGCLCFVFAFEGQPFNGSPGFVLNADQLTVQLIHASGPEALASALSIVTMRPVPTRANGRKEI